MVWCNTTRTDTIDFGILGHTTNNGSEQPYETLSKIIRHDQVLVVWNAPVPTTGRFPGSQLNTHKIAFPVSKNQWLPCPSGMRIIQCSLLTVTRSRRSSTCFPFTLSPHFAVPGTDCPIFDMHPSYHSLREKAMKKPYFVAVHALRKQQRILPMLRIPNRQNLLLPLYHTAFSVQKMPTRVQ